MLSLFDYQKSLVLETSERGEIITLEDGSVMPNAEVIFFPQFFSEEESDQIFKDLIENIEWQQDKIKFYGKLIDLPRLTAWYGDKGKSYTYSGIPMNPHSWTSTLQKIKSTIEKVAHVSFSSVLLNRYRNGKDSVAWHSDNEPELGKNPVIGSVSFGATRKFKLRYLPNKEVKTQVELTHGSFLLMREETQHYWEHEIPKTAKPVSERLNLTFRVIH